jgi:hypothetical protein
MPAFIMNTESQIRGGRHGHHVSVHDGVESAFTIDGIGSYSTSYASTPRKRKKDC